MDDEQQQQEQAPSAPPAQEQESPLRAAIRELIALCVDARIAPLEQRLSALEQTMQSHGHGVGADLIQQVAQSAKGQVLAHFAERFFGEPPAQQ